MEYLAGSCYDLGMNIQPEMTDRQRVVEKLTALLAAWEEGVASADGLARIREAGDVYVEALAEFIDSRAKRAVLGRVAE